LRQRKTENEESLRKRLAKAEEELTFENKFDHVLVNDVLEVALDEAQMVVRRFIHT
jgi:guanylate kinase